MCALVLQCPVSHSCSSSHSLREFCRRTTRLFSSRATEQLHWSRLDSVCFACGYMWVLREGGGRVIYPQPGHFWSQCHLFDLLLDFYCPTLIQSTCSSFNSAPIITLFSHYCCKVQLFKNCIPICSVAPLFINILHSLCAAL